MTEYVAAGLIEYVPQDKIKPVLDALSKGQRMPMQSLDETTEREVLLIQRHFTDPLWPGRWYPVSEHVHPGESWTNAIRRGIKEETGLDNLLIIRGRVEFDIAYSGSPKNFKVGFYHMLTYKRDVKLNHENAGSQWIPIPELAKRREQMDYDLMDQTWSQVEQIRHINYGNVDGQDWTLFNKKELKRWKFRSCFGRFLGKK